MEAGLKDKKESGPVKLVGKVISPKEKKPEPKGSKTSGRTDNLRRNRATYPDRFLANDPIDW